MPGYCRLEITADDVICNGNRYPLALQDNSFFTNFSAGQVVTADSFDRQEITYI